MSAESAIEPVKWTEAQMQDAIYIWCAIKQHELIIPNSCLFGWEADMISVTKSGYIHEIEIKVSRSDFRQDCKKDRAPRLVEPTVQTLFGAQTYARPNYFWYAVPKGLIDAGEIPDYAGLLYVQSRASATNGKVDLYYHAVREVKPAKRLHKETISESQQQQLSRALTVRYWRQRISGAALEAAEGEG